MGEKSVALMIYGDLQSGKDALTEEKYKDLAKAFSEQRFQVRSVLYNDEIAGKLISELPGLDAILVWVNPIEQGRDRVTLDALLKNISDSGCYVSAHPEIILKIGTKEVLYRTKDMDWGGDIKLYRNKEEFENSFASSLKIAGRRILKQYRGNGGNGVFRIDYNAADDTVSVIHAFKGNEEIILSPEDFYKSVEPYFENGGMLIDQEWNANIVNGMVRCYLTGTRVSGFGYQEVNALYPSANNGGPKFIPPGKRFYFSENCGLFRDLKEVMEDKWVPQLLEELSIASEKLPVIWDADFFINKVNNPTAVGKYTLCEINTSSVSPFPPSSVNFIVDEVKKRISNQA